MREEKGLWDRKRGIGKSERETVREGLFLLDSWSFECRVMMGEG